MDELSTKLERDLESCNEIEKELTCNILNFITWDHPEAARYTDMRNSMELPKALFSRLVDMLRSHGWITTTTGTGIYEGVLCLAATSKLLELNEILRGKKDNDNPTEQKGETMSDMNTSEFTISIVKDLKKLFPFSTSTVLDRYYSVTESLFRHYPEPISKKEMCDWKKPDMNKVTYCIIELIKIGYVERVTVSGKYIAGNTRIRYVATEKLLELYKSHGAVVPDNTTVEESQVDDESRVKEQLLKEFPSCTTAVFDAVKSVIEFIYLTFPKTITTRDIRTSNLVKYGSENYVLGLLCDRGYLLREGYDPSKNRNDKVIYSASPKLIGLYEPISAVKPINQSTIEKGDNEMSVSVIKPVDAPSPTYKVSDTVQVNKSVVTDEKSEVSLVSIDEKLNTILSRMDKMDERINEISNNVSCVSKSINIVNSNSTSAIESLASVRSCQNANANQVNGLRTDFRQLWEKLSAVDTKMNAFDNRLLYIDKHTEKIDTIMDSMTELVEKVDNLENVEEVPAPKQVYVRQPSQGGEVFDSKFSYIYTQLSSINTQMKVLVDGMEQLKEQRVVKDPIGKEEVSDQEDDGEDFTEQFLQNLFSPWPTDGTKMDSPFKQKVQQVPFTFPHMESFNNKTKDIRQLAYDEVRDNILQVVHNFRRTGLEEVKVGIFISPSYLIQTPLEKSKGHFNVLGVEVDTLSVVKGDIPKNSIIWDNPLLDVMATIKKTFPVSDSTMGQNHTSVSDIVVEYMAYGDAPMCAITFKLNKM